MMEPDGGLGTVSLDSVEMIAILVGGIIHAVPVEVLRPTW